MRRLFDVDNPLMSGLSKIFDCIMLSLCWVVASLPILTMGTASGALYRTVYRCLRRDETGPLKMFWETFRKNIKMGILTWLPVLALYAFLIFDAMILRAYAPEDGGLARLYGIVLVLIAVCSVWASYVTAYCVRFEGSFKDILWLSCYLVLAHPLMTIVIAALLILGGMLALTVPVMAIFVPAGVCLGITYPMERVFLKHMRPEDVERVQNGE